MTAYSNMRVELISSTPDPERVVALAARLCYSPLQGEELKDELTPERREKLIDKIIKTGHHSVLEHVSFSFLIEGVSRVSTHQLVRHRIGCSYSQKSQRYVREREPEFVVPPAFQDKPEEKEQFIKACQESFDKYCELVEAGIHQEMARYLLPQAIESSLMVTMNARALYHFFQLRCCTRAQEEIRVLAWKMLKQVKKEAPLLFSLAGPSCESGPCPEGDKSCGRSKRRETN